MLHEKYSPGARHPYGEEPTPAAKSPKPQTDKSLCLSEGRQPEQLTKHSANATRMQPRDVPLLAQSHRYTHRPRVPKNRC